MLDHCLYFNTIALVHSAEHEQAITYALFNLTPPQGFVLRMVLKRPDVLNREPAEVLGITRPTATRPVDGLITKGLAECQPPAEGGREWNLSPTEATRELGTTLQTTSPKVAWRLRKHVGTSAFDDTAQAIRNVRSTLNT